MDYKLTKPCPECPFTDTPTSVRGLHPGRIRDLCRGATDIRGATFACHKTVDYAALDADDDDGTGDAVRFRDTANEQHCAGALIFGLKQGALNQMGRIAERLGMLDCAKLMADAAVVASVYGSARAMAAGHRRWPAKGDD